MQKWLQASQRGGERSFALLFWSVPWPTWTGGKGHHLVPYQISLPGPYFAAPLFVDDDKSVGGKLPRLPKLAYM